MNYVADNYFSFNTQPPEGGCWIVQRRHAFIPSFNTQPPEGGCCGCAVAVEIDFGFNTQPPEGGWFSCITRCVCLAVSTHSRLKAAVGMLGGNELSEDVSTHSRLKAAVYR